MKILLHLPLFILILWMPINLFAQTNTKDNQDKLHSEKQALKEEALKKLKTKEKLKRTKVEKTSRSKKVSTRTVYTHKPNQRKQKIKRTVTTDSSAKLMRAKPRKKVYEKRPPTPPQSQIEKDKESLKARIIHMESLGVLDEKAHKQLTFYKARLKELEEQK